MIGPLAYIGGKRRLAPTLIKLFPRHTTYVEALAGGAQVFFHKPPSRVEVLNDLDGDIVNFLRVCREHADELIRVMRFLVPSRRLFAEFAAQQPESLTDVQRAARFLYVQRNGFAGRVLHRNFHYCVTKPSNFNPSRLPTVIERTAQRLARVQLEQLPYEQVLERYDRETTFFYLDPPYYDRALYRFNFTDLDFRTLADHLARLKGTFLLSINDTEAVRQIFGRFAIREQAIVYTASRHVPRVRELLVSNYKMALMDDTSTSA
jgi:DNA adenine methylase